MHSLFLKIKYYWKRFKCSHTYIDCNKWHWTHYPNNNDYRSVEIEYCCKNCGKIIYVHLFGRKAKEWAFIMGDYKKE